MEQELTTALGCGRHERAADTPKGYRHGTRARQLTGSFGPIELSVPRARLAAPDGGIQEWRSAVLPRYAWMTRQIEALIAGAYLAGTNTRRVKRALGALFRGTVGKEVVSRTWRKVRTDWEAWSKRDLAGEDIVRLILDGTVVRVRLDRKATNLSLLVVLGVRRDGQKVLLSIRNMAGESEAAWRAVLDDLVARGLRTPEFLITDGAAGLERALAALWPAVPAQRCTVHKHRNLLAHAPDALHDEVSADDMDMIYASSAKEVEQRRRAFLRTWRVRCPAVAASLEEAGERLFAFLRLPSCQWRSARTTNAIERLHEESSAASRHRPCCRPLRPRRCCSGPLWPRARSPCALPGSERVRVDAESRTATAWDSAKPLLARHGAQSLPTQDLRGRARLVSVHLQRLVPRGSLRRLLSAWRLYRVQALARAHGDRTLGDVVRRFRCQVCGAGAITVVLSEAFEAAGAAGGARVRVLIRWMVTRPDPARPERLCHGRRDVDGRSGDGDGAGSDCGCGHERTGSVGHVALT